jgi:EamA-like transporter family
MSAVGVLRHAKHPLWWADVMLLLVAVVWGASYGLAKTAVAFYPVLGFLAIRFCLTSAMLLPTFRGLSLQQLKEALKVGVPLGLILLSVFLAETYGVSMTRASNAAFLISLCMVFTPFVEWIFFARTSQTDGCAGSRGVPGWSLAFDFRTVHGTGSRRCFDCARRSFAGVHGDDDQ